MDYNVEDALNSNIGIRHQEHVKYVLLVLSIILIRKPVKNAHYQPQLKQTDNVLLAHPVLIIMLNLLFVFIVVLEVPLIIRLKLVLKIISLNAHNLLSSIH